MLSLARALAPDHAGDPAAMARLLGFTDADTALAVVSRWRGQFEEAVLVVDQFEELFTLNAPEAQASFIELLRRLVDAADVHVVLAMRDDYLYRCQEFTAIAPIFEALTPLPPPTAEGLRRALKEPAARQLYRFESELLVDRMIAEVGGERGALPLMAFAVHRLWEERDREGRLLTGEAYERIGGVAGALAKHADATLERIGGERMPIVRELFRNLVTAEGTRAVREVDELLSVFPETERKSAEEVLQALIDARLLTSYKHEDEDGSLRRVEIVHESLLTSWPRLVRWQTQDADGALLRDQLRQTARIWDEHDRSIDYLWTGRAFREFDLWRESYPGRLSAVEDEFATAMTSHALRRRRWRRFAYSAALVFLLAVLSIVVVSRQQAVAESRRAEAAKLLALGQLHLEDYPTATLAHAIGSLELSDTVEARMLALQALWKGPTAIIVNEDESAQVDFAGEGDWLVQGMQTLGHDGHLRVVSKDGSNNLLERVHSSPLVDVGTNPEGSVMYSSPMVETGTPKNVVLWSLPDGQRLSEAWFEPPAHLWSSARGWSWNSRRLVMLVGEGDRSSVYAFGFDGTTERLGTLDYNHPPGPSGPLAMDRRSGRRIAALDGDRLVVIGIGEHGLSEPRVLGRHAGTDHRVAVGPDGRLVATASSDGQIKIWDPDGTAPLMEFEGPPNIDYLEVSADESRLEAYAVEEGNIIAWVWSLERGSVRLLRRFSCGPEHGFSAKFHTMGWDSSRRLFAKCGPNKTIRLWSLSAPSDADPIVLARGDVVYYSNGQSFHPSGRWLAVAQIPGLTLWPLSRPYPWVIRAHSNTVSSVAFGPGGAWIASGSESGVVRLTPLAGEVPESTSFVHDGLGMVRALAASSDGTRLLVGRDYRGVAIIPLDGTPSSSSVP